MRPHVVDADLGSEICRVLGLDPRTVHSMTLSLNAAGVTMVGVDLLVDDADMTTILDLLRGVTNDRFTTQITTTNEKPPPSKLSTEAV